MYLVFNETESELIGIVDNKADANEMISNKYDCGLGNVEDMIASDEIIFLEIRSTIVKLDLTKLVGEEDMSWIPHLDQYILKGK